jgi:hypothetical protein
MQKWEYRIVLFDDVGTVSTAVWDTGESKTERMALRSEGWKGSVMIAEYVNRLGEEGWELVSIEGPRYVFKRPKP